MNIKTYKCNYLLFTGAAILCCTFITYIILSSFFADELAKSSRMVGVNSYWQLLVLSLIVAPVIEEIVFRGYFIERLLLQKISLLGILAYIALSRNYYLFVLFFVLLISMFIKRKNFKLTAISNALVFGLIHYKTSDFATIFTVVPMFFQFSLGLILIWVTVNFNLLKSMLVHFCFNFLLISTLTVSLQFGEKVCYQGQHDGYELKVCEIPLFSSVTTSINMSNEGVIVANNIDLKNFFAAMNVQDVSDCSAVSFQRYNISLRKIDSTAKKLDAQHIKSILESVVGFCEAKSN